MQTGEIDAVNFTGWWNSETATLKTSGIVSCACGWIEIFDYETAWLLRSIKTCRPEDEFNIVKTNLFEIFLTVNCADGKRFRKSVSTGDE